MRAGCQNEHQLFVIWHGAGLLETAVDCLSYVFLQLLALLLRRRA
jgi:hypothetical protein